MAEAPVLGGVGKPLALDDTAFGARFNGPLLHESVRTSTTCTSKSASTAWRTCVLWASGWMWNVYLPAAAST